MAFDTIHETHLSDITDLLTKGASAAKELSNKRGVEYSGSLTKATRGLIMEFPVLVSKANHIESAGIVAKAYEAKFVTLLQLAFSALNITSEKDAFEYLKNFHTNLDAKFTVDDFIDVMDNIAKLEGANLSADNYNKYRAVREDMRNLCYYFEDDVNESSLDSFKVLNNYGSIKVVKEAKARLSTPGPNFSAVSPNGRNVRQSEKDKLDRLNQERDKKDKNKENKKIDPDIESKIKERKYRMEKDQQVFARDDSEFQRNALPTNLLSSDVKKANELVPTMLVINFTYKETENSIPVYNNVIIGVKAKLYEVEPSDVINKIITKHVDSNVLLKLVKVGTREISFVKDFLLAIDDAKLDALSKSKRGSTNKLFKVLERRALNGKIRKKLKMKDYTKAISSLVISQEECEELLKNNIDVSDPAVIRPIMEDLNLISFAVIDESSESVRFIWDSGDDIYETIPLSKLEKEEKDGMSRKVINLLAKVNR